jgi:hypothetical protein
MERSKPAGGIDERLSNSDLRAALRIGNLTPALGRRKTTGRISQTDGAEFD